MSLLNTKLITADLHLTDKPSELYRFDVFTELAKCSIENGISDIIILGDVTDKKDNHTGFLINKVVDSFIELRNKTKCNIYILLGNHDQISYPTFSILNNIDGITFVDKLTEIGKDLFIPYNVELGGLKETPFYSNIIKNKYRNIFMHHEVNGAVSGNKKYIHDPIILDKVKSKLYSGHIHIPQTLNNGLIYVGSPYHTRYGEDFEDSRFIILKEDMPYIHSLSDVFPKKITIDIQTKKDLEKFKTISEKDFVKVNLYMTDEVVDYHILEKITDKTKGYHVTGGINIIKLESVQKEIDIPAITDFFNYYISKNKISSDLEKVGLSLIKECDGGV